MFVVQALRSMYNLFMVGAEPEPISRKTAIPTRIRNAVWTQYHQNGDVGTCYACGSTIHRHQTETIPAWHCSHVHAESKGGPTTVDNLRTCCRHCNLSMGNQNLYAYIRDHQLTGPGHTNIKSYFRRHPQHTHDIRTNNWKTSTTINRHQPTTPKQPINTRRRPIITPITPLIRATTPSVFERILRWIY